MKRLKGVPQYQAFHIYEGKSITNLYELAEAISSMSTASFKHHVSASKNDFAKWIRDVFQDSVLASKLSFKKTRKSMETAIKERIITLEHELMPASASKKILTRGIVDFVIGLIIGLVGGILLSVFL